MADALAVYLRAKWRHSVLTAHRIKIVLGLPLQVVKFLFHPMKVHFVRLRSEFSELRYIRSIPRFLLHEFPVDGPLDMPRLLHQLRLRTRRRFLETTPNRAQNAGCQRQRMGE